MEKVEEGRERLRPAETQLRETAHAATFYARPERRRTAGQQGRQAVGDFFRKREESS